MSMRYQNKIYGSQRKGPSSGLRVDEPDLNRGGDGGSIEAVK